MLHSIMTMSFYIGMMIIIVAARYTEAAPLYVTDDAQITPEKSCQLEMSQFYQSPDASFNVNPACTLRTVELSLPLNADKQHNLSLAAQLKHTFFSSNDVAIALSGSYQPQQNHHESIWAINLPISLYRWYQYLQIDANLGFVKEQQQNIQTLWAIAATHPITDQQRIGLEYFKANSEQNRLQAIWNIDVNQDTTLYVSYGCNSTSWSERWFGIGLSIAV